MHQKAGQILSKAREKKRLRQEDMADKLGISLRQYHKYEAGEFPKFKSEPIKKIDEILGINLFALIYEQDVQRVEADLEVVIGDLQERMLRLEATLEVYESAIAQLLSKQDSDFMQKVGELRTEVEKAVNRRFDEFRKKSPSLF